MKFNRDQAKALTNAKELEMYDMARPPRLNKLSATELREFVKRSRALRDKLRDVKRKQVRPKQAGARTRGAAPADRSQEKAELFADVHDVFAAKLEKLESGDARAKAKPSAAKQTKTDKNLKTRADRTSVKQKLKKVRKIANAPEPGPTGKKAKAAAGSSKAAEKEAAKAKPKKLLASAAVSRMGSQPAAAQQSAKATFASKSATNTEADALHSPAAASRKQVSKGRVERTRIARSGVKKKLSHVSAVNKRRQGKRDSK